MGAKLSKKKKGYCLGAGKDGESTDTTEVEQKETDTQAGQKDAAEPNGEKTPTDQTVKSGASEEQKAQAEKNSTKVQSGDATTDNLNKNQKSESELSAEQKKIKELNKGQDKSSNTSKQMAAEDGKEAKCQPDKKTQTENKEKEFVAKEEPTLGTKPVTEQSSEPKQSASEPSAPVLEQKVVETPLPDPETKVKVEKMEKEQTKVLTPEHTSEHATKESSTGDASKKPENIPEIVETLVSETPLVEPILQKPVTAPIAEQVEPESTEVSLPETAQAKDLVKPGPDLAPTESVPVAESVESKVSEEPVAPVPEFKNIEPRANPELAACAEPEKLNDTKQGTESLPKPLPSNEVPNSTAQVKENVTNLETSGNADLVTEIIKTQANTNESAPSAEKNPDQDAIVAENCPFERAIEEIQESKAHNTISKEQDVEDKEMQNEVKGHLDKQAAELGSLEKDRKDTEKIALDTSKNENDQVASEDTTVHRVSQDKNFEAEDHKMPTEELSKEPSAPLIVDKHGVGNGLPVKEEVKVHLENGCDKDLHEINGQNECREIEVCNE